MGIKIIFDFHPGLISSCRFITEKCCVDKRYLASYGIIEQAVIAAHWTASSLKSPNINFTTDAFASSPGIMGDHMKAYII